MKKLKLYSDARIFLLCKRKNGLFFTRLSPLSKVLTSYCNYKFVNQAKTGNHNIVLLSSGFQLNVNGLTWFVDNVFPLILRD